MTNAPSAPTEGRARLSESVAELSGVAFSDSFGDEVYFPSRQQYVAVCQALHDAGFVTCADLCGADYLTNLDRPLPAGVVAERFEVVAQLRSLDPPRVVRLRVMVPEDDPSCPTLYFVYPGTQNMEREAYDMFGVRFVGHPDPSRILMPEDWEGHPLRRDYGMGRVPVQFKDAPGPR